MPELPEVEILVRHLDPLLRGKMIRAVDVRRGKIIAPTSARALKDVLAGARFVKVTRRAKYLVFHLRKGQAGQLLLGHLGMTGRMFVAPAKAPLPKHAAVVLNLGRLNFVFEDTRYFGRFTLDTGALARLGPEPLEPGFEPASFHAALRRSAQAIKVKLLDQSLVAGVGNIYASEALFIAGISPRKAARRLSMSDATRLHGAIRKVLSEAIRFGSTVPLDFDGAGEGDGLFYYGRPADAPDYYEERLCVYDRADKPCGRCGAAIKRIVQAARSTFFCPLCQRG